MTLASFACRGEQAPASPEPVAQDLASLETPPAHIAYEDASESLRWSVAYEWLEHIEDQVEAAAVGHEGGPSCTPPTAQELEAAAAELADFVIIDAGEGEASARAPTSRELEDLAYFYAALGEVPAGVGIQETTGDDCAEVSSELEAQREALHLAAERADYEGDISAAITARRAYVESFGYPGPLRRCEETRHAWGGAGFDYAMRELARLLEHEGEFAEAERLYRGANYGGGMCGTSRGSRFREQFTGALRTAERVRGCRAVLADRLRRVSSYDEFDYGPEPLAAAGFDLVRLYRGALLTANRSGELAAAIERGPAALREPARARLEARGREHWAGSVRAVSGLVTVLGRDAEPELFAAWSRLGPTPRAAAVTALGQLLERRYMGECDEQRGLFGGGRNSLWEDVPSLGGGCDTRLTDAEVDALAQQLEMGLADPDAGVREATAHTLGKLLASRSLPALAELARADPYVDPEQVYCPGDDTWSDDVEDPDCVAIYPVREAASEAHAWIAGGWDAED